MKDDYKSFQAGDLVYFIEKRRMAFCCIEKVVRDQARPDYTEYVLEIIKLPRENERFRPLNTLLKHFSVSCTSGIAYSGMWRFYTPEEFEKYYSHYQTIMISRLRYITPPLVFLLIILVIFLLMVSGCFVLIS
jgi:hypothetical protein